MPAPLAADSVFPKKEHLLVPGEMRSLPRKGTPVGSVLFVAKEKEDAPICSKLHARLNPFRPTPLCIPPDEGDVTAASTPVSGSSTRGGEASTGEHSEWSSERRELEREIGELGAARATLARELEQAQHDVARFEHVVSAHASHGHSVRGSVPDSITTRAHTPKRDLCVRHSSGYFSSRSGTSLHFPELDKGREDADSQILSACPCSARLDRNWGFWEEDEPEGGGEEENAMSPLPPRRLLIFHGKEATERRVEQEEEEEEEEWKMLVFARLEQQEGLALCHQDSAQERKIEKFAALLREQQRQMPQPGGEKGDGKEGWVWAKETKEKNEEAQKEDVSMQEEEAEEAGEGGLGEVVSDRWQSPKSGEVAAGDKEECENDREDKKQQLIQETLKEGTGKVEGKGGEGQASRFCQLMPLRKVSSALFAFFIVLLARVH